MKRLLLLIPVLIACLVLPSFEVVPIINPPTVGQTTFFDDFVSSQFPIQWSAQNAQQINNSTQQSGYLVSTIQRNSNNFFTTSSINLIGNNTSPALSGSLNASFTQIVFKMQPFNITSLYTVSNGGGGAPINTIPVADLQFGLETKAQARGAPPPGGIYFDVEQTSTTPLSFVCTTCTNNKQAIYLSMNGGPANGANTFFNGLIDCCSIPNGILYTGSSSIIDLNAQHVFTIQVNIDINNPTNEYVRFRIDNFGWMTFWQTGCGCIGTTFPVKDAFPFITLRDIATNVGNAPFVFSQSIAVQTDYVFATNFVPATLPSGQLLTSNIHPPTHLPQPYNPNGQDSLVAFVQFYANSWGGGNIYAGGLIMTGIIVTIISGTLGAVMWRTKKGIREMGFMWTLSGLGIVFFMFYCGVVPIWLPAIQTILAAGVIFGIVKTGPATGGVVSD